MIDLVTKNVRRLAMVHFVLGVASVITYWQRPEGFLAGGHARGREIALIAILKVFFAWIPYVISGYYSCDVLPERSSRATTAFIAMAIGAGIVAGCLNLNSFHLQDPPAAWAVFAGVTVALLAAARLCAAIWRKDAAQWNTRF